MYNKCCYWSGSDYSLKAYNALSGLSEVCMSNVNQSTQHDGYTRMCELLDMEHTLKDDEDYLLWEAEVLCRQLSQDSLEKLCLTIAEMKS